MRFEPGAPAGGGEIALCEPLLDGNEERYLVECLRSGWISSAIDPQGQCFLSRFERGMAVYLGSGQAVAAVNGTSALHVALLLAGVEPGDEVLVPDLTFVAPANAVRYAGAWPVFIDVEPDHWQLDPEKTANFLARECVSARDGLYNRHTGRRVRALLPVDLLGHPVDMDALLAIANRHDLVVVEDATESLGARYKGRPVGRLAGLSCLSFNGNKLLTTGGGGMLICDDPAQAQRARYYVTQARDDTLEYRHDQVGYNYRLPNLLAAVGCAQLERIDQFVAAKRRIAQRYLEGLEGLPGVCFMRQAPWAESAWWLFTILLDPVQARLGRHALLDRLRQAGIMSRPLWNPLHRNPSHKGAYSYRCDVSVRLQERGLSLPSSVGLAQADQERVIAALHSTLG